MDRCKATYHLISEDGEGELLRCVRDRRHIYAPIGWQEPGPAGRRICMLESAKPHRFEFDVPSEEV